jgi:hypothetical protein
MQQHTEAAMQRVLSADGGVILLLDSLNTWPNACMQNKTEQEPNEIFLLKPNGGL